MNENLRLEIFKEFSSIICKLSVASLAIVMEELRYKLFILLWLLPQIQIGGYNTTQLPSAFRFYIHGDKK